MLEGFIGNVFGRPKNKNSGRNSQHDSTNSANPGGSTRDGNASALHLPDNPYPSISGTQMTGPFSMSAPQMPQMPQIPNMPPYPMATPYPPAHPPGNMASYYPFSQPPSLPGHFEPTPSNVPAGQNNYGTLSNSVSPLDSVPFEAKLSLSSSTKNLTNLDELFREIKKAADVVDRADAYLRSSQSDYDFKIEQGLIYQ